MNDRDAVRSFKTSNNFEAHDPIRDVKLITCMNLNSWLSVVILKSPEMESDFSSGGKWGLMRIIYIFIKITRNIYIMNTYIGSNYL